MLTYQGHRYKVDIQKQLYFYILEKIFEHKKFKSIPLPTVSKNIKHKGINLLKDVQNSYYKLYNFAERNLRRLINTWGNTQYSDWKTI